MLNLFQNTDFYKSTSISWLSCTRSNLWYCHVTANGEELRDLRAFRDIEASAIVSVDGLAIAAATRR
jgi:hypothetical protein